MEEESSRGGLVQLVRAIEAEGKIREKIWRPPIDRFFLLYDALSLSLYDPEKKKSKRNLIQRFPCNFFAKTRINKKSNSSLIYKRERRKKFCNDRELRDSID